MEKILTEKNLQQNGLNSLYKEILDFLCINCKIIFEVTTHSNRTNLMKGYDFIGNVFWPEISLHLINLTPSIFAPGNPNLFHQHYSMTLKFLEDFENACCSQTNIRNLRQHPSYKSFMEKWNLLVYFQIRFREIGSAFEEALISPFLQIKENLPFSFQATSLCWISIQKCWSSDIYLSSLSYKFWKFTLQILSRYTKWINNTLEKPLKENISLLDNTIQHNSESRCTSESQTVEPPSVTNFITLVNDIEILQKKITEFFKQVIKEKISELNDDLYDALECGLEKLAKMPTKIGKFVVQGIVTQCSQQLKMVSDIPRLYRKTNREVPSKPSLYVSNVINQIESFLEENSKFLSSKLRTEWCLEILNGVTQQFLSITNDVIISVKRMEDSLKRLKRVRDKNTVIAATSGSGISDDDKIRLQLALDVECFGNKIEGLGVHKKDIQGYDSLVEIVESARVSPSS